MNIERTRVIPENKPPDPFQTAFKPAETAFEEKAGDRFGDCVIETPIGLGAVGAVYRARHTKLETFRAVKVLKKEHVTNSQLRDRFLYEAKVAANLNHPCIVQVHSVGEENGKPYIEMEYIEGPSLRHLLHEKGCLPTAVAAAVAEQVGEALHYAHQVRISSEGKAGIVHRDIKPENILVSSKGSIKIVDFGLAKDLAFNGETAAGMIVGTVSYMPTEQIDGKKVDGRSDLYALSAILYEMTAGFPPFRGETYTAIIKKIISGKYLPVSRIRSDVPRILSGIIEKGLKTRPEQRFQTVQDFLDEVKKLRKVYGERPDTIISEWLEKGRIFKSTMGKSKRLVPFSLVLLFAIVFFIFIIGTHKRKTSIQASAPHVPLPLSSETDVQDISKIGRDQQKTKRKKPVTRIPPQTKRSKNSDKTGKMPVNLLAQAKECLTRKNSNEAEGYLKKALLEDDDSIRAEAAYYLIRIKDERFRHGRTELKQELKAEWQNYLKQYSKNKAYEKFIKDAKQRLLYILSQ